MGKRKVFFFVVAMHIILVLGDLVVFEYEQVSDSIRYIFVANEFDSRDFFDLNPEANCVTAPGYPFFLALIKPLTNHNKFLIGLIQATVFAFSLFFVIRTLEKNRVLSKNLSLLVFTIVLFSPEIFKTNGVTLTESLTSSLLLLSFGALFFRETKVGISVLLIASYSLLILVKFEYLFLLPVILLFLFFFKKIRVAGWLMISLLVFFSLNGYKNLKTFGKFNPTSFGSGTVIYGGNNLNGDGSWHNAAPDSKYYPEEKLDVINEINLLEPCLACLKRDSLFKKMAKEAWKEDWRLQLSIIPLKFGKLWFLPAEMDFYTAQKEFKPGLQLNVLFNDNYWPWYGKYKHGVALGVYWVYLILIISGFIIKLRKQGLTKIDWFILYAFAGVSFLYSVPFYGLGRFHVPVFPLLAIYSVFSINQIDDYFLNGRLKMLVEKLAK